MDKERRASLLEIINAQFRSESGELTDEELRRRAKHQKIEQREQTLQARLADAQIDRELKRDVAEKVFKFLAWETVGLFSIIILQGFGFFGFKITESTINIFSSATIIQISTMAIIITRYLFKK